MPEHTNSVNKFCPVGQVHATITSQIYWLSSIGRAHPYKFRETGCDHESRCEGLGIWSNCPVKRSNQRQQAPSSTL
jgi:hypothetical protein